MKSKKIFFVIITILGMISSADAAYRGRRFRSGAYRRRALARQSYQQPQQPISCPRVTPISQLTADNLTIQLSSLYESLQNLYDLLKIIPPQGDEPLVDLSFSGEILTGPDDPLLIGLTVTQLPTDVSSEEEEEEASTESSSLSEEEEGEALSSETEEEDEELTGTRAKELETGPYVEASSKEEGVSFEDLLRYLEAQKAETEEEAAPSLPERDQPSSSESEEESEFDIFESPLAQTIGAAQAYAEVPEGLTSAEIPTEIPTITFTPPPAPPLPTEEALKTVTALPIQAEEPRGAPTLTVPRETTPAQQASQAALAQTLEGRRKALGESVGGEKEFDIPEPVEPEFGEARDIEGEEFERRQKRLREFQATQAAAATASGAQLGQRIEAAGKELAGSIDLGASAGEWAERSLTQAEIEQLADIDAIANIQKAAEAEQEQRQAENIERMRALGLID